MYTMNGQVEGIPVAKYRKGKFTLTCKICKGTKGNTLYCVTFHNGRQTNTTYYSTDMREMNNYIIKSIQEGFKKTF